MCPVQTLGGPTLCIANFRQLSHIIWLDEMQPKMMFEEIDQSLNLISENGITANFQNQKLETEIGPFTLLQ